MSTNDEKTYTPVKQLVRFHIESIHYYPQAVWQLIALHVSEILKQHGCDILPGQSVDLETEHRPFGRWILKFEFNIMNGLTFYPRERMMSELRSFMEQSGANKFEIDFENVR